MSATQAQNDVVDEWREPQLPTAFAGGHAYLMEASRASIEAVIEAAGAKPGDRVLDIGCGSGIPSIDLARVVGPTGHVTATDPSPVFVEAARRNAAELGLANMTVVETSAAGLPFDARSFDAVTAHYSVMFLPDVQAGLTRIREVLKPGARAGFVVWGAPQENLMFGAFWSVARPFLPPDPPPDPNVRPEDIPSPVRFAAPGSLSAALTAAGFQEVREEARNIEIVWPGPAETNLAFWLDLTKIEEKLAPEQHAEFRDAVLTGLRKFERSGKLHYTATIVIASGSA